MFRCCIRCRFPARPAANSSVDSALVFEDAAAPAPVSDEREKDVDSQKQDVSTAPSPALLREQRDKVLRFCSAVQLGDALRALEELTHMLQHPEVDIPDELMEVNNGDVFTALRLAAARMQKCIGQNLLPCVRSDVSWMTADTVEPFMGEHFKARVSLRWADAAEWEVGGPSTQLFVSFRLTGLSVPLHKLAAFFVETDIFQKEWLPDCEHWEATVGGSSRLHASLVACRMRPKLMPFALQEIWVRQSAVYQQSPEPSSMTQQLGGLLVSDWQPPLGQKFEGWTTPRPARGSLLVKGTTKTHYFTPDATHPDCSEIFSTMKICVPIWKSLFPNALFLHFLQDTMLAFYRGAWQNVMSNWSNLPCDERISANPEFYGALRQMSEQQSVDLQS